MQTQPCEKVYKLRTSIFDFFAKRSFQVYAFLQNIQHLDKN